MVVREVLFAKIGTAQVVNYSNDLVVVARIDHLITQTIHPSDLNQHFGFIMEIGTLRLPWQASRVFISGQYKALVSVIHQVLILST